MTLDKSRNTFDELRRYSAVLMQQGRVLLDADFNELVDIFDTRLGKLAFDALGNPGIPFLTNPDAFLVTHLPGPPEDLALTPGRIYLDFLMAEIFEGETVTYLGQPYLPDPPPLPAGDAAIYLEIYEEELSWVEASLLDPALGGVDTTGRRRTVFQLHVDAVDAAECGLDVGDPPSAGRLTTRAVAPPAPDDPCLLPPVSGYRGLENRFYRVEVHDGGPLGTARFKFSRDNGSIASPVTAISSGGGQTVLDVVRIGRDPVLRFALGDWVTVTDDHREWMDEPGEMAQVVDINEADGTITVDRDLPTGGGRAFGANADQIAERHTRIQKWDQSAAVNALDGDGLIVTQAGALAIGDGIELTFSTDPAGGDFRRGDYWTFWARTATASIEELTDAPPRGIERHYVQLAAATDLGGQNPEVTDCRPQPDPVGEGCCTIVVQPGDNIQDAIDALPGQGGCICFKAGVHPVPATLTLDRANVHMHGESHGAILQGSAPLLSLGTSAQGITIEMLDFLARIPDPGIAPIIEVNGSDDISISDCRIAPFPGTAGGVGILLTRTDGARIAGNTIFNTFVGVSVLGLSAIPVIEGNAIVVGFRLEQAPASAGIWVTGNPSSCHIRDNVILGAHQGVVINDQPFGVPRSGSGASMILDNAIATGVRAADGDNCARGIDAASEFTTVRGNMVFVAAPLGQGIRVSGTGSTVIDNKITAPVQADQPAFGIQIGYEGDDAMPSTGIVVRDNQIAGLLTGVLVTRTSGATVADNQVVTADSAPTFGVLSLRSPAVRIETNRIAGAFIGLASSGGRGSRIDGNDVVGGMAGLMIAQDTRPSVCGNRLAGCRGIGAIGMQLVGCSTFSRNSVTNAGSGLGLSVGIGAALVLGEWVVDHNEVADTGVPLDGDSPSAAAWGIFGDLILEARVQSNLVTYSNVQARDVTREDRALRMRGLLEFQMQVEQFETVFGFPVQILDNKFIGTGASALVELLQFAVQDNIAIRFERVFFSNNYCMHASGPPDDSNATVVLVGRACTVMGNHIKATMPGYFSFDFNGMRGPFVGNVTSGNALQFNPFPPAPDGDSNFIL